MVHAFISLLLFCANCLIFCDFNTSDDLSGARSASNSVGLERRCAIDIGSGMMKMQDADINKAGNIIRLGEPYFAKAALANHYFEQGEFKNDIQEEALSAFENILLECKRRGVKKVAAVATAIFRKAGVSGELLLQRLVKKAQQVLEGAEFSIQIITQELEAEAGFLTGCVLAPEYDKKDILVLDVGNASLQIVSQEGVRLAIVGKSIGNAIAAKMFMEEIRKSSYDVSMAINPITPVECDRFCVQLCSVLSMVIPSKPQGIAIGGHASIFALGCKALNQNSFTRDEIKEVIKNYLNKDNSSCEIQMLDAREPETAVVKLMLLYSLMESLSLNSITYKQSAGNTIGILLSSKIWKK